VDLLRGKYKIHNFLLNTNGASNAQTLHGSAGSVQIVCRYINRCTDVIGAILVGSNTLFLDHFCSKCWLSTALGHDKIAILQNLPVVIKRKILSTKRAKYLSLTIRATITEVFMSKTNSKPHVL
jgi:hypothetical protein